MPVMQPGDFVRTSDKAGLGRLIEIRGDDISVSLFDRPDRPEEVRRYRVGEIKPARLLPNAQIWMRDARQGRWRVGRLWQPQEDGLAYDVMVAGGHIERWSSPDLRVRRLDRRPAVVGALASEGWEAQRFCEMRIECLRALLDSRAACRGLTGLVSASVDLLPHQLEVVRRVLEDSRQRYLLADEVGLGKTIEAGAVIRQRLLDDRQARVLIIVPPPLLQQWRRELRTKFHVDDFPERVVFRSFSDEAWHTPGNALDLLVVDEVHKLTGDDRFGELTRIAHLADRVLLLSAVPAVGNEDAMLSMLHLLDPDVYKLEDRTAFREKVARNDAVGRMLLSIDPERGAVLRQHEARRFRSEFPDDPVVASLAGEWASEAADTARVATALKQHLAENYRIHQRMLRTRRKRLEEIGLAHFSPRQGGVEVVHDGDPGLRPLWVMIETWREHASHAEQEGGATYAGLARRFRRLFDALGAGAASFKTEFRAQWNAAQRGEFPSFAVEAEVAEEIEAILRANTRIPVLRTSSGQAVPMSWRTYAGITAVDSLRRQLVRMGTHHPKIVVFGSDSGTTRKFWPALSEWYGVRGGVFALVDRDHQPGEVSDAVRNVRQADMLAVLVCDETGEHGLNLQFADGIVHLDLPTSPIRVEQRIGRLDRFGRVLPSIEQRVVIAEVGQGNPWQAWYGVLGDGLQVFDQPCSDVQFFLEELEGEIDRTLLRQGLDGLTDLGQVLPNRLLVEREKLDRQAQLEELWMSEEQALLLDERMREYEEPTRLAKPIQQWMHHVVSMRIQGADVHNGFRYVLDDRVELLNHTPLQSVRTALAHPHTTERQAACADPRLRLFRIGSPMVDWAERIARRHDRGRAFGTWRIEPTWEGGEGEIWVGFRLFYLIEPRLDLDAANAVNGWRPSKSVRRRLEGFFPSSVWELDVDFSLRPVEDAALTSALRRPFNSQAGDSVLGAAGRTLEGHLDHEALAHACDKLRSEAVGLLRNSPDFRLRVEGASAAAEAALAAHNEALRHRQETHTRQLGAGDPGIVREIHMNGAIIRGLRSPGVSLDSVGLVVVSNGR